VSLGSPLGWLTGPRQNGHSARLAAGAGAEIRMGTRIKGVKFEAGWIQLSAQRRRLGAQATAGWAEAQQCHGSNWCRRASPHRAAGVRLGRRRGIAILRARVRLPRGHDPDLVRVWFDRDLSIILAHSAVGGSGCA
jgi:hypothetical protein